MQSYWTSLCNGNNQTNHGIYTYSVYSIYWPQTTQLMLPLKIYLTVWCSIKYACPFPPSHLANQWPLTCSKIAIQSHPWRNLTSGFCFFFLRQHTSESALACHSSLRVTAELASSPLVEMTRKRGSEGKERQRVWEKENDRKNERQRGGQKSVRVKPWHKRIR